MRSFLAAYEASHPGNPPASGIDAYRELMAKKEEALRGWIAYVAMANPNSPALTREYLHAVFGAWVNRAPVIEQRGQSWFLIG